MPRRKRSFFQRYRILVRIFFILLATGLGLGFAYWISSGGPKNVDYSEIKFDPEAREQARTYLDQSMELEAQFIELAALRSPTKEDLIILSRAINAQEQYKDALGGYDVNAYARLEELRTLYQDTSSAQQYSESLLAEQRAAQYERDEDFEQALVQYRQAALLQRGINDQFQLSSRRSIGRLTRLERKVNELRAQPLWNASKTAEKEATSAEREGRWGDAKQSLLEAIRLQKELNDEFRGSVYDDVTRLSALEVMLASMQSSDLYEDILVMEKAGQQAFDAGLYQEAAEKLKTASRMQLQLNSEHPSSRFASKRKVDELDDKATDASSREIGMEILDEIDALDQALRERKAWQSAEIIPVLFDKTEAFQASFSRSTILGEDTLLKLRFLKSIKEDISLLQDRLYGLLLPIPEIPGWHMMRIEVPQALYETIMLTNPSRNQGDTLPVDSVVWDDASSFSQRVSWIMGYPVSLPTKEQYYAALGSLRYVDLDSISWNAQNSDDQTHQVGTKEPNVAGYHDLLGNVGEWLLGTDLPGTAEAYIAGGSAQDSVDILADVPMIIDNTRRRNRMTGFRIAVNLEPMP